jgi:type III secretion system YscD/HrpQ family protein
LTTLGFSGAVQSTFAALFVSGKETANAAGSLVFADADELRRRLSEAGLGEALSIRVNHDGLLIAGHLSANESRKLKDIIEAVHKRNGVFIATDLDMEPTQAASLFSAVAVFPRAYVVTKDDRKLEAGDRLPNGPRIDKITEQSVVLDSDGIHIRVNF